MAAQEEEKAAGRRAGPHPLLRGRRRDGKYTHGLHPAQMEALRAMCGAFIPSLPAEEAGAGGRADPPGAKDLERFYLASAADSNIPDEVRACVRSNLLSCTTPRHANMHHHVVVPALVDPGFNRLGIYALAFTQLITMRSVGVSR